MLEKRKGVRRRGWLWLTPGISFRCADVGERAHMGASNHKYHKERFAATVEVAAAARGRGCAEHRRVEGVCVWEQ